MEHLSDDVLLKFNSNTLMEVRHMFGFENAEDLNKAIDILDNWVKKQDHFVKKDFSRDYIERGIMYCKGSLELTKSRIDKLFTMKTLMPHYFVDYDFDSDFNFPKVAQVMLPKLTKDHRRVYLARCDCDQFTSTLILNIYRLSVVIAEYTGMRDYVNNFDVILDLRETNLAEYLMNVHVTVVHQFITILLNGYGARVKGLHLLTSSKLIDGVVTLIKPVLSEKLRKRIKVHKNLETLYEFVPKDVLPIEYGGEERPLNELYANWVEVLSSKDFKEIWRESSRARTDESRRQTDKFNEKYMGMSGTFRSLSVD